MSAEVAYCAMCGAESKPWLLVFHNGQKVCSGCAASTHDEKAESKRKIVLGSAGGVLLVLIAVITFVVLTGHWSEKSEIGKSLHAMRYAVAANDVESIPTYIDSPGLLAQVQAACESGGDPNAAYTAQVIWQRVISTAVQGGEAIKVDGDRAVLRNQVVAPVNGQDKTITVDYELQRQGKDRWKIVRLLNASQIFETHGPATP